MPRPDRSLAGAHDALRDTPKRRAQAKPTPRPIYLTTVLRWMAAVVLCAAAVSMFGSAIAERIAGWL